MTSQSLRQLQTCAKGQMSVISTQKVMVPSGKRLHSYGKSTNFSWENPLLMAIFNSYVKLPEGKSTWHIFFCTTHAFTNRNQIHRQILEDLGPPSHAGTPLANVDFPNKLRVHDSI